jgi:uncharacterized protein YegL
MNNYYENTTINMLGLDQMPILDKREPKVATVLLVDTSGSMTGEGIDGVNRGIKLYQEKILSDSLACKRVELSLVSFNDAVSVIHPFSSIKEFSFQPLTAGGWTTLGQGILAAIDLIKSRKEQYAQNGTDYFRPWIFLITDATDNDMTADKNLYNQVINELNEGETNKHFSFYKVAVGEDVNFDFLKEISSRSPLRLKPNNWDQMFDWFAASSLALSRSSPGISTPLPQTDWGTAD